jgi:hypothetical protein
VTSFHGTRELSYLSLLPSAGVAASTGCPACANGRPFPCRCAFGAAADGAAACGQSRTIAQLTLAAGSAARLSNASIAELLLTAPADATRADAIGYGANMTCLFKRGAALPVAAPAYWRQPNSVACRLDPSKIAAVS